MHALFVVAKYAKGGIYSRQHYFKLSLNQCSLYCQVCKARRLFVCDFCPCHCKFSYSEQDRHGEVLSHVGGSQVHEILQQAVSLSHHDLSTSVRIASHASTVVHAIETIIGFFRVKKGCRNQHIK